MGHLGHLGHHFSVAGRRHAYKPYVTRYYYITFFGNCSKSMTQMTQNTPFSLERVMGHLAIFAMTHVDPSNDPILGFPLALGVVK
jgi:hypothetical protein